MGAMTGLDQALDLAGKGWFVMPVGTNKVSLIDDWPNAATTDAATVTGWWTKFPHALAAVVPGRSGHTVIDIDMHEGKQSGFDSALEFGAPLLADVYGTSLSGKGRHLWYCGASRTGSSINGMDAIDARSIGGYAVVAYDLPAVAEVTEELPPIYYTAPSDSPRVEGTSTEVKAWRAAHTGPMSARLRRYVEATPQPFIGNDYMNGRIVAVVHLAREGEAGATEAMQHLADLWAEAAHRENKSAANDQFEFNLKSAIGKFGETMDNKTEPIPERNKAAPFTAEWLMRQRFPPIKYVVPGIVPEGMTLLVAAPKIGKSYMVLGIGLELSTGGNAFGALPVGEARPVLYLALEDGQRRLQSRLRSLDPETVSPLLQFQTEIDEGQVIATIRDFMTAHAGADPVVILDTLGKVMPQSSGNASQYGHDYKILSAFKATSDAVPGSSLLIVHHTRKSEGADFLDAVSGTQGIAGAADTVLVLHRERHEKRGTLQVTSRDAAEGEYSLTMSEDGVWELDGESLADAAQAAQTAKAAEGVGEHMANVIEAVSQFPDGGTRKQIIELIPEVKSPDEYLRRAVESGRIERRSRGVYAPVISVRSVSSTADYSPNLTDITHITPPTGEQSHLCTIHNTPTWNGICGRCRAEVAS